MTKSTEPSTITIHVPMKFAIRGGRKTVIFEAVAPQPLQRTDNALLKALARAHRWRQAIEGGQYSSITELAKAQKINESYACRLLRLTLLAPEFVVEVLDGKRPADLTLAKATKPLSTVWAEQKRHFSSSVGT